MFGFLGKLLAKPVLGTLFGGADRLLGRFFPNKDMQLDADTQALINAQQQFSREFQRPTNLLDSIINAINRLPRPILALSAIGMLYFPFFDPITFVVAMQAMELVPPWLWGLVSGNVTFYFGSRTLEKHRGQKVNKEALDSFLKAKQGLQEKKKPAPRKRTPRKKAQPEWKNPDLIE